MNKSSSIGKIAAALVKFQSKVGTATKDAKGNFSKYATLNAYLDVAVPALAECGLSVAQFGDAIGDRAVLTTILMHESGEWIEGSLPLMPIKNDPQMQGSAITYARRYCLAAALCMVSEDDDAENAMGRGELAKKKADVSGQEENQADERPAPLPVRKLGVKRG